MLDGRIDRRRGVSAITRLPTPGNKKAAPNAVPSSSDIGVEAAY
jgi:hypothetical protein